MVMTPTLETGRGELFWPDGRSWGTVNYQVSIRGRITGRIASVADRGATPFLGITDGPGKAHLQLSDGRWWICILQADGAAVNAGGLHASRPPLVP